jgi:hypothetical protein
VVQNIPVRESPTDRLARVKQLKDQLLAPATSARAAIRLEALETEGELALLAGLESDDEEVRFYAAEALAYLDHAMAARVLAATARDLPAFRQRALAALGSMDDPEAYDSLSELLHVASAETRYGAFRELADICPDDPQVAGRSLGGILSLHIVGTMGEPMVHITRSRRPEIVLFGTDQPLRPPIMLFAGNKITVTGDGLNGLCVRCHSSGDDEDVTEKCPATLDQLIPLLVRLGATYPDVIQVVNDARQNHCLSSRVVFDRLPRSGRTYLRNQQDADEDNDDGAAPLDEMWPEDPPNSSRVASNPQDVLD